MVNEPVRLIERTGMAPDYCNEFIVIKNRLLKYCYNPEQEKNDPQKAYESIKNFKLKKYTERLEDYIKKAESYNIEEIKDLEKRKQRWKNTFTITEKNKKQVYYLSRIVDEIKMVSEDFYNFDCKRVWNLVNQAYVLIYGESEESHEKRAIEANNKRLLKGKREQVQTSTIKER